MFKGIDRPQLVRELPLKELIATTIKMLTGKPCKDYAIYEGDKQFWALRLDTRKN